MAFAASTMIIETSRRRRGWIIKLTEDASLKGIFHFIKTDVGLFNSNNFASTARSQRSRGHDSIPGQIGVGAKNPEELGLSNFRIDFQGEHDKYSDDVDSAASFSASPAIRRTRDRFRPQIISGEFQTNYRFEDWSTTTFGVQYNRRSASTRRSAIDKAIRNIGYYLQEQIQFLDRRLIMIPGIRLDDNQQFGTEWTPSFSAAYFFREIGTKLKAWLCQGF